MSPDELRVWVTFGSSSPLYRTLVDVIAGDSGLLQVLSRIEHTPEPNILFAGVQYLLMSDPGQPLASHYPSIGTRPPEGDLASLFREFVLAREDELIEIGRTRYTQTNECRRCAVLLPLIWRTPATSFHLVDVGTSAGLNLHLDRYRYEWDRVAWGPESTIRLETESRGSPVAPRDIVILSRTGLDLHPVDPSLPDERRWLEALIWPEHQDRRERLQAALALAARHPVEFVAGDAVTTIGPVLDGLQDSETVVVMNSFTFLQFSSEQQDAFRAILEEARRRRPVIEVSFDAYGRDDGVAALHVDDGSGLVEVGLAHPHGEWVELYDRP